MNIFLLFISMFIMIGYYIMSSPSQNVAQQETQYVIEQSDIRSIAECVISIQNKVMYCQDFDDFDTDCIARYNITSQYAHVNDQNSVLHNGSMADLCADPDLIRSSEVRTYIMTTSYALPVEERNNMLDILEKYYSDRGNLGIIEGSQLIVPDSIAARDIPASVISSAELQDGQLAYIMLYRNPNLSWETPEDPGGDEPPVCPEGTVLVNIAGVWRCRPIDPLTFCQENTVWNSETQDCEPTEEFKCENENATLVQMADGTWVCLEPNADINCENGVVALNANTLEWECVNVDNPEQVENDCTKKKPGYIFATSTLQKSAGPTLKVKTISCGRCEKPKIDIETCELHCVPDVSKLNTRTCFSGDPACCTGSDQGIYFGFAKNSTTDGILGADGKPVEINLDEVLDDYHATNRKFNCLRCKYSSLDTSKSIYPYVAMCTGSAEAENVEITRVSATSENCNTPVVVDDDDDDWAIVPLEQEFDKGANNDKPKEEEVNQEKQDEILKSGKSESDETEEEKKQDEEQNPKTVLKPVTGKKQ